MENLITKHLLHRALLAGFWAFALLDYFITGGSTFMICMYLFNGFIYVAWTKATFKARQEGKTLENLRWYKIETGVFIYITFTNAFCYFADAYTQNTGLFLCFFYALACSIYFSYNLYNRKTTALDTWLLGKIFKVEE